MAFTTYIFREDLERLKNDAALGSNGGSLYGQLTSTGNPVVHVAFSETGPLNPGCETKLYESYRLCHIGEWIAGKLDFITRQNLLRKYKGHGSPSRFVVLEVASRVLVTPYLFVEHTPEKEGKLEELKGENPFNRRDVLTNAVVGQKQRTSAERHHATAGAVAIRAHQSPGEWQRSPAPRGQVAHTSPDQWYGNQEGQAKLKFVLDNVRAIAQHGEVDMARDTETHDMCMSFTDLFNKKKWEVKFSFSFPRGGVLLTNKSQSRTTQAHSYQTSSSSYGNFGLQSYKLSGCERVDDMVEKIKNCIRIPPF